MERALELARKGLYTTMPNPRVGCVIVKDNKIVGEGFHEYAGGPHAEITALKQAASRASGGDVYLTLEPCSHRGRTSPCCDEILAAKVRRVVLGTKDPNPQASGCCERLREAGVLVEFSASHEAKELNLGFFSRHQKNRPWIRVKLAISIDGKIALKNGDSRWISSSESRLDVHYWRARSCAILSSSRTVLNDDPRLDARLSPRSLGIRKLKQPLRVIVDSRLKTPPRAKIFSGVGMTLIATCARSPAAKNALERAGKVEVLLLPPGTGGMVSLEHLMLELARREINEIQVEAGGVLSGALIAAGMFDELLLYQAPSFLGDGAIAMASMPTLKVMSSRLEVNLLEAARIGDDLRLIYRKEKK